MDTGHQWGPGAGPSTGTLQPHLQVELDEPGQLGQLRGDGARDTLELAAAGPRRGPVVCAEAQHLEALELADPVSAACESG